MALNMNESTTTDENLQDLAITPTYQAISCPAHKAIHIGKKELLNTSDLVEYQTFKVTPINFTIGESTENDIRQTILKEKGEYIVTKEIGKLEERFEAIELLEADPKRLRT